MIVDSHDKAPPGVPANKQGKPAGVLFDHGTGKRIPFAVWFDLGTGWYEALRPSPCGQHMLMDANGKTVRYRAKAVGRLELVSMDGAARFGVAPKKVQSIVEPAMDRVDGLDVYKKIFTEVWQWRGEARRCVDERFAQYLEDNELFDCFVLKRRNVGV